MIDPQQALKSVAAPAGLFAPKRSGLRRKLLTAVQIRQGSHTPVLARSVDIDEIGISMLLGEQVSPGDVWEMRFNLVHNGIAQQIQVKADVSYQVFGAGSTTVGFRFQQLDVEAMSAITRYVSTI